MDNNPNLSEGQKKGLDKAQHTMTDKRRNAAKENIKKAQEARRHSDDDKDR